MTQYLLLIHGNSTSAASAEEWEQFFHVASEGGLFKGGSEIGDRTVIGEPDTAKSTEHIVGFMRFDAEVKDSILRLLEQHPVVAHGGTVELCEMPKSSPA